MTDKVLVKNSKTGAMEVKQLSYFLPSYDIGQTVGYLRPDFTGERKDAHASDMLESEIEGIEASIVTHASGEIMSSYIYTLADGMMLTEEEIEHYYD